MTKLEAYTIRLLPKELDILNKYCELGKKENSQIIFWEKIDDRLFIS